MESGIRQMVALIRPTLGPLPHVVAQEKIGQRDSLPEMLDSGGAIARRVIEIPNRDADVGAMYLRHVLWSIQEAEGDGTATAAVMFDTIYHLGRRFIVSGGSPMLLREHLEAGMRVILKALDEQVVQLSGKTKLIGLARTICYDEEVARLLGEIFDIIGTYGRLEVRRGSGHEMLREYVEGIYYEGGLLSRGMSNADMGLRANLENAALLISDLELNEPEQLVPLLEVAYHNNIKQVLLICSVLSERAMGLLTARPNQEKVFVAAVKIPGLSLQEQQAAMEDLAILTGGRPLVKATGAVLNQLKVEDFGYARRAWADKDFFGIVGGRGDARVLRRHIGELREAYHNITDPADRKLVLERLGRLTGGSATLYVGGISPTAIEAREELAKRTADAMRGAMRVGVVPGGGVALLRCRTKLQECHKNAMDAEERAAYSMLIEALEAPFRTLVENAGFEPGKLLAEMETCGPDYGFDVLAREVVDMRVAGLYDAAPVVKAAVRGAISGAALALTTDVIVHRRNPPEQYNP